MADEIADLYDQLAIQETELKLNFSFDGYKFWINKGKGFIRRKQRAALAMQHLFDEIGMAEGRYESLEESLLQNVVAVPAVDGGIPVELVGDGYDNWLQTLPEVDDNGTPVQLNMVTNLPRVVAMVMLGKSQVSKLIDLQDPSTPGSSPANLDKNSEETEAMALTEPQSPQPARAFLQPAKKAG